MITGKMLLPGGLDVASTAAWRQRTVTSQIKEQLMGGLWAPGDYIGMQRTLLYPEQMLALERYLIVEPEQSWQVEIWAQYFTPAMLEAELGDTGFAVGSLHSDLMGTTREGESEILGVVATRELRAH